MKDKFEKLARRKRKTKSGMPEAGKRLLVTRSCKYLFAQIIDIQTGKTLLGLTDKKLTDAKAFGEKFAKEAAGLKIKEVIFDRGGNLYHGRVKAFAEGAREGGLKF